ncbi:MAG TPA: type IV secretory system conjugative DNA transfer family protein, partial [Candidatus Gracilibacteria bacterium]
IIEIPDFTKNIDANSHLYTCELKLERNDLFPIKDFRDFDGDSLSGVLNVMSKVRPGEGAWIQIVAKAVPDTGMHHFKLQWRRRFDKVRQRFRVKYWFKKSALESFGPKISEKISGRTYEVNLRIAASSNHSNSDAASRLKALLGAMANFNTLDLNRLNPGRIIKGDPQKSHAFSQRSLKNSFLVSTKELASLYHLPNETEVPNILHVLSRKAEPPSDLPVDKKDPNISFFGMTNFHGKFIPFGMQRSDRRRHLYTVGKSGSGKSKLLELLVKNDLDAGKGIGVLDPHGDLVDNILEMIPEHRIKDVVIFDPSDMEYPVTFNPLADVPPKLKMRVTIGFIEIFKKLFGANWTPRLEHVLRYTTLALLDTPGTTIFSILKMLTDKNYRQMIVRNIKESNVKNFWVNEFAGWSEKFDNEAITPLLNKVGQFVATDMIRNIVAQPDNKIDFRGIMDNQKILLMKVSKGILGEENAALLGAIAITKIYQAAMSRADIKEEDRVDFYFYVDEFQNFATDTFDEILSEARKYRLNLTIAHQFLGQLSPRIRTTVFGNVGSMVSFRVGGEDAGILADEYNPRFSARDIINLGVRDFYTKMSINGELREAFSGRTLNMEIPKTNFSKECIDWSRKNYTRRAHEVEEALKNWEENAVGESQKNAAANKSLQEEEDFEEPLI